MVQDIAPFHFDNSWENLQPNPEDWIIECREHKLLIGGDKSDISFPRFSQLCQKVRENDTFLYLFAVGGERYFLHMEKKMGPGRDDEANEAKSGFRYVSTRFLRGAAPRHLCYAGLVGAQLAGWYAAHRFCGGCGHAMLPDERERMVRCPSCGQIEYPKLCPCVIVGVIHDGKILVSWYKNGFTDHYALIAGFAEVGETIEETVAREVYEETHVRVKNLRYYKSQPWPYSESLLFGFFCDLDGSDEIIIQEDELAMAKWVTPEEIFEKNENFSLTNEMICKFKEDTLNARRQQKP